MKNSMKVAIVAILLTASIGVMASEALPCWCCIEAWCCDGFKALCCD